MHPIYLIPPREMAVYIPLIMGVPVVQKGGPSLEIGKRVSMKDLELVEYDHKPKLAFRLEEEPTRYVLIEDLNDAARSRSMEYGNLYLEQLRSKLPSQRDSLKEEMEELGRQIRDIFLPHIRIKLQLVVAKPDAPRPPLFKLRLKPSTP
jgi:hypothetical protein